ncbi:MAG: hypothetical protein OXQ92_02910 [Boseongicola sp.]|nr:hypothetical protein [Boseongicola sp.]MDD9977806.1 hypothetical protein [Boseongicola sp.]
MSFVRPEVQSTLKRWSEPLAGLALIAAGSFLLTGPGRGRFILGLLFLGLGLLFVFWGIQRARFHSDGGGVGVVEVDERQISYFSPAMGGALALEDLTRVAVVPPHAWELSDISGQRLTIPVDAKGADALFETLVALPGFSAVRLSNAAQSPPSERTIIWSRSHTGHS